MPNNCIKDTSKITNSMNTKGKTKLSKGAGTLIVYVRTLSMRESTVFSPDHGVMMCVMTDASGCY